MASYISKHHGGGWRYTFHIPAALRPMLGGKRAFIRYIKRMPRREAEAIARKLAVDDAVAVAEYRKVSDKDRQVLARLGGLPAILSTEEPKTQLEFEKAQHTELYWRRLQAECILYNVEKKKGKSSLELAHSWDGLFEEWKRIQEPKRTRNYAGTIRTLKSHFGERDCRQISQLEIGKFRDSLTGSGVSRQRVATHLRLIHAMFSAVAKEPTCYFAGMTNPAAGVKVLGKNPPAKGGANRVFTPLQVKLVIETAAAAKFGDGNRKKRHTEILWILRLLTFTGARPNEICQLQGADVFEQDGVKCIRIQEIDAVTGKKHREKSVKTGEARIIPLHPAVLDFYVHAAQFASRDFIFGAFRWNKDNGRAAWLTSEFPAFLKNDCKIVEPTKELKLYSLRHTFVSAMRIAKIPEDIQKQIVGHRKDVHGRYGGGELRLLAEYVATIKPMG
jgi:integrase